MGSKVCCATSPPEVPTYGQAIPCRNPFSGSGASRAVNAVLTIGISCLYRIPAPPKRSPWKCVTIQRMIGCPRTLSTHDRICSVWGSSQPVSTRSVPRDVETMSPLEGNALPSKYAYEVWTKNPSAISLTEICNGFR